jgi:hypothetical protein
VVSPSAVTDVVTRGNSVGRPLHESFTSSADNRRMRALLLASVCFAGCGTLFRPLSLTGGAGTIFSQSQYCPAERVTVTPRPEIAPHAFLVRTLPTPPAEIAADAQRLKMWRDAQNQEWAALDRWGHSFSVAGCGKFQEYVCGHPTRVDFNNGVGLQTGDNSFSEGNGTREGTFVMSAVQCLPRAQSGQSFDADAVRIPEHTDVPSLPAAIRALTVRVTPRHLGSDLQLLAEPIPEALQAQCRASSRRFCESFGWKVVEDASADLEALVPCVGTLDANGQPQHDLQSLEDDNTVELRWPQPAIPSLELRAHGATIAVIPVGPLHLRCEMPRSFDRAAQCEGRWAEWENARMARLIGESPSLNAFAAQHAH